MATTDLEFVKGELVYHKQREAFALYVEPAWTSGESHVDFGDDDVCRITTAQLVPAADVASVRPVLRGGQ